MTSNAFGRVARFGVGLLAVAVFMVSGPSGAPAVSANHLPLPDSAPDNSSFTFGRQAPIVDSFAPTGTGVSVNAGIAISFTQPMSRASIERTFSIRPRVDGRLVWLDDFTLGFQPDVLAHSATYEVEVHGRSSRGVPMVGTNSWIFSTAAAPPIVLAPGPLAIRVPILMYHYIRANPYARDRTGFALSVTPADFEVQMTWLARNGYHPITTNDLYSYLSGARGLPSRPVILTFDDGYADFYNTALPILRSHDFTAVAYVVSGFVGRPGYMSPEQVLAADRAGIEIGSHTVDHVNLARQSGAGVRYEVSASKQALERLLGHPVYSFCYPYGGFNSAAAWAVQSAGYRDATTTKFGFVETVAGRYVWGRVRISGGEGLGDFTVAVAGASS
jgi:peptidoglycan/xylan/chitin deacetylase (PgdA/CDA1 family)